MLRGIGGLWASAATIPEDGVGLTLDDYLEPCGHRLEPEAGPAVADIVAAETAGFAVLGSHVTDYVELPSTGPSEG